MIRASILGVVCLAATQLHAEKPSKGITRVSVCIARTTQPRVAQEAEGIVSGIFSKMGIRIVWREALLGCESGGIRIAISENTPDNEYPKAMAYAKPFAGFQAFMLQRASDSSEDFHIKVFFDRIQASGERLAPRLFAHVLTHEITHVLQGTNYHAAEGVMKARFTANDYAAMMLRQLPHTREDIELIQQGLAMRADAMRNEDRLVWEAAKAIMAGN